MQTLSGRSGPPQTGSVSAVNPALSSLRSLASLLLVIALAGAMNLSCGAERRLTSDEKPELPQAAQLRWATASVDGRVELSWTENRDSAFLAYELYRGETAPVSRAATRILHTRDRQQLSFVDASAKSARTYYYKLYTLLDDGRMDSCTDKVVRIPQLTDPGIAGVIDRDTIWDLATSPVLIKGDLTIAPGVRLTVMPGVTVRFAGSDSLQSGRHPDRSELIVAGTLVVAGENGQPVRFTSTAVRPEKDGWGGIWFQNATGGSNNSLRYLLLEYARDGIRLDASMAGIYRCRFERLASCGLDLGSARVTIADSIFHDIGTATDAFAIRGTGSSDLRLSNCLIHAVNGTGLWLEGGSASVHHALVADCRLLGVGVADELLPSLGELIIYQCATGLARTTAEGSRSSDYHNIWATSGSGAVAYRYISPGLHDRAEFPRFVAPDWSDPSRGDFRLIDGSPLATAGQGGAPMGLYDATRLGFALP